MDHLSSVLHHHQEIMASHPHCQSLDNLIICSKPNPPQLPPQSHQQNQNQHQEHQQQQEKKPRPPDQALKCPRCDSANTKFCYYNNYSLSQPRYFCKSCRRYWTKGGTLRNVPVGGGCRKNNKRLSSSSSSSSSSASFPSSPSLLIKRSLSQNLDHHHHHSHHHHMLMMAATTNSSPPSSLQTNEMVHPINLPLPSPYHDSSSDLSLAFARLQNKLCNGGGGGQLGFEDNQNHHHGISSVTGNAGVTGCDGLMGQPHGDGGSFIDSLRSGLFLDQHPQNNHQNNNGGLGFQNLCYGFAGEVENGLGGGIALSREIGTLNYEDAAISGSGGGSGGDSSNEASTAATVTAMKQEICGGSESRALWGFPWQMNGDGSNNMGAVVGGGGDHVELGRESWNVVMGNSTSWHGLLNSPLM